MLSGRDSSLEQEEMFNGAFNIVLIFLKDRRGDFGKY